MDSRQLRYDDLSTQINVLKRRKLVLVRQYLEVENYNVTSTTMEDIKKYLDRSLKSAVTHATVNTSGINVNRGAPKVYTDHLKEFSGNPIGYEEWEGATEATPLRWTHYKDYLNRLQMAGNVWEQARNEELYNMILSAVHKGHAFNLMEKVKEDPNIGECSYSTFEH